MVYATLATLLAVFYTFFLSSKVGKMRDAHSVQGPATTGNIAFERSFRAHQNTIEQLVIFLPCMWLGAAFVGDLLAGVLGLVWVGGRFAYVNAYEAGESRFLGMWVTVLPTMGLFFAALFGVIQKL
jgi:glutathione S-transferase